MSRVLKYVPLVLVVFFILWPLSIALMTAMKTEADLAYSLIYEPPKNFTFVNFKVAFEKSKLDRAFFNTFYIIVLANLGNVFIGSLAAYALGRFKFKLKSIILGLYALAMIIPGVTTQVAVFGVVRSLGLVNTLYAMVVLSLGTDLIQLTLYIQFINNIPYELDESAIVDGASLFRVFRSIVFPLMIPATVTSIILRTIGLYNDIYTPYLYMPSPKLSVISTVLMRFSTGISTFWTLISAAALLCTVPTVLLYLILQKKIMSGIVVGAIKG